jgi:hypothetical protein
MQMQHNRHDSRRLSNAKMGNDRVQANGIATRKRKKGQGILNEDACRKSLS